jgi:hypothetical protein
LKVTIEAASQEEFDAKRAGLADILKGRSALEPRRSVLPVQNQIVDHWDSRFNQMLSDLKEEIGKILAE